jgi:hypothetical protein
MIKIKTIAVGGGVDLAREERIKKVDQCIDHFMGLYKSKGFVIYGQQPNALKIQNEYVDAYMMTLVLNS